MISPLGITRGTELATEGQGKGKITFWSKMKFHLSLRRKMPMWEVAGEATWRLWMDRKLQTVPADNSVSFYVLALEL